MKTLEAVTTTQEEKPKRGAGGGNAKAQFLVKCADTRCSAKAGPIEDKKRCLALAFEHAASFGHVTEIYRTRLFKAVDPKNMPRLMTK